MLHAGILTNICPHNHPNVVKYTSSIWDIAPKKRMDRRIKPDIVMNYTSILGAAYQPMWFDSIIWMLNFMICYPWKPINPLNFDSCGHFLKWWCPYFIHLIGIFHHKPSILGILHLWKLHIHMLCHRPMMSPVWSVETSSLLKKNNN